MLEVKVSIGSGKKIYKYTQIYRLALYIKIKMNGGESRDHNVKK